MWRNRFAAEPNAIGHPIRINDRPAQLAGAVPDGTSPWVESLSFDAWLPYERTASQPDVLRTFRVYFH